MITEAALSARKATAAGLGGITPWVWRRAIEASQNHNLAAIIAKIATRWGRGDYTCGNLIAASRLIALWKDKARVDARPIAIGGSLRRLISKAYSNQLRNKLHALLLDQQFGVLRSRYEAGVHSMRHLAAQCQQTNKVIALLEFS